jgi:hypothetical protein
MGRSSHREVLDTYQRELQEKQAEVKGGGTLRREQWLDDEAGRKKAEQKKDADEEKRREQLRRLKLSKTV